MSMKDETRGYQPAAKANGTDGIGADDGTSTNMVETMLAMVNYGRIGDLAYRIGRDAAADGEVASAIDNYGVEDTDELVSAMLDALDFSVDNEARELRLVLCTGGPHYEIRWTQGKRGTARNVWFLGLPWFDRCEIRENVPSGVVRWAEHYAQLIDDCYENGIKDLPSYDEETFLYGADNDNSGAL